MGTTDETIMNDDVVETIRGKLSRGEELKPADLHLLQPFHEIKDVASSAAASTAVPPPSLVAYLNRQLLLNSTGGVSRNSSSSGKGGPQLVRYVGMVQDMLDPEYYVTRDSQGRSTHFLDANILEEETATGSMDDAQQTIHTTNATVVPIVEEDSCSRSHPGNSQDLAERTPLVVVPIPFASEWLLRGIQYSQYPNNTANTNTSSSGSPKSVMEPRRKRGHKEELDDDDDGMQEEEDSTAAITNSSAAKHFKSSNDDIGTKQGGDAAAPSGTNQDWWPAGCCGTPSEDCPVLAKFAYDQLLPNESTSKPGLDRPKRLLLNELVSIVGVLSMNPWEADFSCQQQQQQQQQQLSNGGDSTTLEEWMSSGWGGDAFATPLPPPSRLPRVHVLSYQRLDLDTLTYQILSTESEDNNDNATEDEELVSESSSPYCPRPLARLFSSPSGSSSSLLAQSLWICLMSKADRRININSKEMMHVGPLERALGCCSLQVSMPDMDSGRALVRYLAKNLLPQICPVVATVDLTLAEDRQRLGLGPSKDHDGRLRPSPVQLPAGSVLLVHSNPTMTADNGNLKTMLQELVQHHRLTYRFEGGVILPFEADYQIIVVTTQTQQLPCTASILSKDMLSECHLSSHEAALLRNTLCRARNNRDIDCSKVELSLPSTLLERAQQDFLSRRRMAYDNTQQGAPVSMPGEDKFHCWLNTTKLLAKSRICGNHVETVKWEATVKDWETALTLGDKMQ